ncbi:uncharacterized protein B0H18DRAFT_1121602 [Fomitopsis serialis]|uniref:uncharacterized protein n=1 Tax=Fomitopsis serialis TaxID=139415 RepID=UPI00200836E4|nr:uncharacterized protein B0H18DRAFT_1121602 [Neoantrodia serialis]KAH9921031.1 hypothetical protein B0H18DRAFT_1121602 [Neoantrodia serialis]
MRTTVAVAVILAAASAAPSLAVPISLSNALAARDYNGELEARDAMAAELYDRDFDEELYARELNGDLEARSKAGKVAGHVAKGLFHIASHFLKREDPVLARAIEEEPELFLRALDDDEVFARDLEARSKAGKVAGHVAKGLFHFASHFLRSEDPVLARAVEEEPELFLRALDDDEVFARDLEARSKAGKIAEGLNLTPHFSRSEDPVLARALEEEPELFLRALEGDEVLARDLEARSKAGKVAGHVAKGLFHFASHFLRNDEELMAREFDDDMLFARGMEIEELD